MTQNITINEDGVEQIALGTYSRQAYLNYSMYVINDRALPHIARDRTGQRFESFGLTIFSAPLGEVRNRLVADR